MKRFGVLLGIAWGACVGFSGLDRAWGAADGESITVTNFGDMEPVTFPHTRHTESVDCADCHHPSASGGGHRCGSCHASEGAGGAVSLEQAAHAEKVGKCWGCHLAKQARKKLECENCHRETK